MQTRTFCALIILATVFACGARQRYWGDIHAHTSWSLDGNLIQMQVYGFRGRRGPEEAFIYARDSSKLDFVAITDHAEQYGGDWQEYMQLCDKYNQRGSLVTLPAWEFSDFGGDRGAGHKNVYFRDNKLPPQAPIAAGRSGVTVDSLWKLLAGYNAITVPHHPARGQGATESNMMNTNWDIVNAEFMPIVEIYSVHGCSEIGDSEPVPDFLNKSSVDTALNRWLTTRNPGYKLGIIASTDNHLSTPGGVDEDSSHVFEPEGHYTGGLAAVYATSKTRVAIYDALKNRNCYGTSGPRIALQFAATASGAETPMGGTAVIAPSAEVAFTASATGDNAAIDRIELIKNGAVVKTVNAASLTFTEKVADWSYYRIRAFQKPTKRWDGVMVAERAWSSPIWVETSDAVSLRTERPGRRHAGQTSLSRFDLMGRRLHADRANTGIHVVLLKESRATALHRLVLHDNFRN